MKNILVIDNYDSFTYNLVHYLRSLTDVPVEVFRNDEISIEDVNKYDKILLSPGPGIPIEAGICLDLIKKYAPTKSIMGVCLGQQAIGEAFGGSLINLEKVYHGVSTTMKLVRKDNKLFDGIPETFKAGRYHSWVVAKKDLPACFNIDCEDEHGMLMAISHKEYNVVGVQFHPESVLTENGMRMVENWLKM